MIEIRNDGQAIVSTTYWQTEHANVGLLYLSGNAGALRLLVPETAEPMICEMRTGRAVTIEPSQREGAARDMVDLVFEDGTESPFSVAIDRMQIDRSLQPGSNIPFTVWTSRGQVLALLAEVRV
jgi:hypothetical protein